MFLSIYVLYIHRSIRMVVASSRVLFVEAPADSTIVCGRCGMSAVSAGLEALTPQAR